jgi:hypothetical protein
MLKMPARLYFGFMGRCSTASREYAVLKTFHGELIPLGDYDVEILCTVTDAELLLDCATRFYPDAVPYIQTALASVPKSA